MLKLAIDAAVNGDLYRALLRRQPDLDLVRAQDVGLRTATDPEVLAWAVAEGRILLTHDRRTMTRFANERVEAGLSMPGVFVIHDKIPVREAIDAVLLADGASEQDEWRDQVVFLKV